MIVSDSGNPRLEREGDEWVLVLARTLEHPVGEVWSALTQADRLAAWGPFRTDRDLTAAGAVQLAPIGVPEEDWKPGEVLQVDAPHLLVFRWGDDILRWELSADEERTVLVLRHRFADRKQSPSYAAGWHLCLSGLAGLLDGREMPSMAGLNAYNYGYDEWYTRYARQLGIETNGE